MSKLAHSHQPSMNAIDRLRAIEDGNEDLIPPFRAHKIAQPLADAIQQAAEEEFVKADRNYLRVMHNVSAPDADCDDAFEARERAGSFAHDADHVAALVEHILSKRED